MIPTGKASRTDGRTDGNGRPQAPAASGMGAYAGRRVAVIVDGGNGSVSALRQAASQARQRSATLDLIYVLPEEADARTMTLARVRLGEFSRRACPYGVGAPVRLRVERGDLDTLLPVIQADVELLITVPGTAADQAGPGPTAAPQAHQVGVRWTAARRRVMHPHGTWLHTLPHASS
jgi:Universal stress protein family